MFEKRNLRAAHARFLAMILYNTDCGINMTLNRETVQTLLQYGDTYPLQQLKYSAKNWIFLHTIFLMLVN